MGRMKDCAPVVVAAIGREDIVATDTTVVVGAGIVVRVAAVPGSVGAHAVGERLELCLTAHLRAFV